MIMGEAVVSALVRHVLGRLTSEVIKEFGLLSGFKNDILNLKEDFTNVQAVLQDAEEKHIKEKEVDLWLKSLRSVSLMVENLLDDVSTEAMIHKVMVERGIIHKVRAFFSSDHNQLMFRVRVAHKVKAIKGKLDAVKSKRCELGLTPSAISHVYGDDASEMPNTETSSLIHDSSVIFGRNDEMEMITKKICNKDIGKHNNDIIRVYGIWGMGGVGKTTLAQLVYNHERVNRYFEFKCWVYVSKSFQVKEIIKKIIEVIDKCGCTLTQLETLQESIQSKLRGKKFLIILDDVWIEDGEKTKWEQLSETLSCGVEGSMVMMTTRSHTTSLMMAKVPELQHKVNCLSEEDSWLLFKKFAFEKGRKRADMSELEPIGREIVKKCEGLPLAVKTLGSLMWSKSSTSDWQHVNCNIIWELQENNVLPALMLSYDHLLPHIKRCFAYCCLFPKGYEMERNVVIQLWVANDFIPPRGEINLFVLGEEIFNCLVWRSFFTLKVNKFLLDRYIMHDLMHDIARHVMGDDCLIIESGKEVIIPNEVLHLSSSCPDECFSYENLEMSSSLRSIFMFGKMYECQSNKIFNHMYLKVLYLCGIGLKTLPESICKLKHLKYLNLSKSKIEILPDSVIYLQNLQVLILSFCWKLHKLPEGLRYLRNLQSLDINSCYSLKHLPLGIKELTRLRVLSLFPVGIKSEAKIGELRDLDLLEGKLEIAQLDNVGGFSEAMSANIKCKRNLSVLMLSWSDIRTKERKPEMFAFDEVVLNGLEPNLSLKILKINYYMGKSISPSWMVVLKNLVKIEFSCSENCEYITQLERLPKLKVIRLEFMASLKCFHDVDTNMLGDTNMFSNLNILSIWECPNLISLPSNLPNLKDLNLGRCAKLEYLPSNLKTLEKLQLVECDGLLSLPDEIESFKDVYELNIYKCKHLSKRCKRETDVEWPKISHISDINIDSRWNTYRPEDQDEMLLT